MTAKNSSTDSLGPDYTDSKQKSAEICAICGRSSDQTGFTGLTSINLNFLGLVPLSGIGQILSSHLLYSASLTFHPLAVRLECV